VKKLNVILLILSFILSGIGSIFLFNAKTATNDSIQTNAPSNKIEREEITAYTMKTWEDYYIDYFNLPSEVYSIDAETGVKTIDYTKVTRKAVSGGINILYNDSLCYTITSKDYTGSGTESDPYIFNSLNGFLYLINPDFAKIGITNKFLKLNCDLVLNDEIFDKNGNPSGGDGVYYNWNYMYFSSTNFDGNGHTISGLYGETEPTDTDTSFTRSLFGRSALVTLENLTMKNIYIDSGEKQQAAAICRGITQRMSNCKILSGNVKGHSYVGGFVYYSYFTENCENYADLYSSYTHVGGIVCHAYGNIDKCNNYGNIIVENTKDSNGRAGGITYGMAMAFQDITISNCNNYGNIDAKGLHQVAGIISWGHGTILNCNNYGVVTGSRVVGGIVAYLRENEHLSIISCNNYGMISSVDRITSGQIFGINSEKSGNSSVILIKDCFLYCDSSLAMLGYLYGDSTIFKIQNCKISYNLNSTSSKFFVLFYNVDSTVKLEIQNIEIIEKSSLNQKMFLYGNIYQGSDVTIRNVVIKLNNTKEAFGLSEYDIGNPIIDGLVVSGGATKVYYGTDFSGLYFSWRTGKTGVVALDGRGQFQGVIDEEWLNKNGYEKKSVE